MEILNCPFCGSECSIKSTTFGDSVQEYYRVQCDKYGHCLDEHQEIEHESIKSWNTRFINHYEKDKLILVNNVMLTTEKQYKEMRKRLKELRDKIAYSLMFG